VTPETCEVLAHLASCFAAPYRVLGERAGSFDDDGAVVRAYEAARAFGELTLAARERLGEAAEPLASVAAVLERAAAEDPSGRLALYCVAVVVGPRLLVSLRDARALVDADAHDLLDHASDLVVAEIVAIRDLAGSRPSDGDALSPRAARALGEALDAAGFTDSLGVGR
jgi:hypothetical protein